MAAPGPAPAAPGPPRDGTGGSGRASPQGALRLRGAGRGGSEHVTRPRGPGVTWRRALFFPPPPISAALPRPQRRGCWERVPMATPSPWQRRDGARPPRGLPGLTGPHRAWPHPPWAPFSQAQQKGASPCGDPKGLSPKAEDLPKSRRCSPGARRALAPGAARRLLHRPPAMHGGFRGRETVREELVARQAAGVIKVVPPGWVIYRDHPFQQLQAACRQPLPKKEFPSTREKSPPASSSHPRLQYSAAATPLV